MGSDSGLFRDQVLRARQSRLHGELLLTQPPGMRVFALLLLLVAVGGGVLLYRAEFARTERVNGYLVPEGGVVLVQAPGQGVVARLAVTEGARVAAGDLLLQIEDPRRQGSGAVTGDQLLTTLQDALVRNRRGWQAERRRLQLEQRAVESALARLTARESVLAAQQQVLAAEMALAERHWQRIRQLHAAGHVAREVLDGTERGWLELEAREQALRGEQLELKDESARLRERRDALPLQLTLREGEYEDERGRLQRELLETSVRWRFELRAPHGGRVAALNVEAGDAVRPGTTLLTLLGPDARMQAVLLVPSRAAGFIQRGQQVRLRYDAFPHARFGTHPGTVTGVGSSVLAPSALQPPAIADEPVYKVRVALQRSWLDAYGQRMPLQAGMALEADVVLERRPLWTWLVEPVLALRGRLS